RDTDLVPRSIIITRKATAATVPAWVARTSSKRRIVRPTFRDTKRAITARAPARNPTTGNPVRSTAGFLLDRGVSFIDYTPKNNRGSAENLSERRVHV